MEFAGFQSPWALSLMPLAAVPWLLHLLRRKRWRRIYFPSLMLLADRRNLVLRRYRIEEILLLAIRTLLVASLVAAMARPLVSGLPGWLSSAERWVVVILDDSASMAAARDGMTAMDLAKERIGPVLRSMGSGARVALVSGGRGTQVLAGFGEPDYIIRAIEEVQPRPLGTDLAGALALAGRMLEGKKQPSVLIVSDFQKYSFGQADSLVPGGDLKKISVFLLDIGLNPPPQNLAWLSVKAQPLLGRMAVEVKTLPQARAKLVLQQGGRIVNQISVVADSNGRFSAGMELPPGDSLCLWTSDDGLALDDTFFLADTRVVRRCLVVAEPVWAGQALLRKALDALSGSGIIWKMATVPNAKDIKEADVVLIAARGLDTSTSDLLSKAAESGTGFVFVPPAEADVQSYNRLLSAMGSSAKLASYISAEGEGRRLSPGTHDPGQGWDARAAEAVQVFGFWRANSAATPALTIGGLEPGLIFEETGLCRTVLWTFGIDPAMSDVAYRSAFPVLLHRSLDYSGEWCPQRQFLTGDSLRMKRGLVHQIIAPNKFLLSPASTGDRRGWELSIPGWYRITGSARPRSIAVNLPAEESELEKLDLGWLEAFLGLKTTAVQGHIMDRQVHPAWQALILMALLLLAVEAGLRIRLAGQKNG